MKGVTTMQCNVMPFKWSVYGPLQSSSCVAWQTSLVSGLSLSETYSDIWGAYLPVAKQDNTDIRVLIHPSPEWDSTQHRSVWWQTVHALERVVHLIIRYCHKIGYNSLLPYPWQSTLNSSRTIQFTVASAVNTTLSRWSCCMGWYCYVY
jgi:hypothetical protein